MKLLAATEVFDCQCYGNIQIFADDDLILSDGASTTEGFITIVPSGTFTLPSFQSISAIEGFVIIQAGNTITLSEGSTVIAFTSTSSSLLGNVVISVNGAPGFTGQASPPINVTIDAGATDCYFGIMNITAYGPSGLPTRAENHVRALDRFIAFDTNGLAASYILLAGGVTVQATGA